MDEDTTPQGERWAIALARAKIKSDPDLRRLADEEGVGMDALVREYAAELRKRLTRSTDLGNRVVPAKNQERFPPQEVGTKTLPAAIVAVLTDADRPMKRLDIYKEAVRRGWIAEKADPNKQVGTAVRRLIAKGTLVELDGKKPRRVRLADESGGVEGPL